MIGCKEWLRERRNESTESLAKEFRFLPISTFPGCGLSRSLGGIPKSSSIWSLIACKVKWYTPIIYPWKKKKNVYSYTCKIYLVEHKCDTPCNNIVLLTLELLLANKLSAWQSNAWAHKVNCLPLQVLSDCQIVFPWQVSAKLDRKVHMRSVYLIYVVRCNVLSPGGFVNLNTS